jgi:hypothetical protein
VNGDTMPHCVHSETTPCYDDDSAALVTSQTMFTIWITPKNNNA